MQLILSIQLPDGRIKAQKSMILSSTAAVTATAKILAEQIEEEI